MPIQHVRALGRRIRRWLDGPSAARPSPAAPPDVPRITWKEALRLFFDGRAGSIDGRPTLEDLCFASGREPRLWTRPEMIADLTTSIVEQAGITESSSVLEVGCGTGFIARAVAPGAARYTGVDVAIDAVQVARRLGLPRATFEQGEGARLRFADGVFDAALCYDVFTNFPRFDDGAALIAEMIRVVRPGTRALVGSVPDAAYRAAFEKRVAEVSRDLDAACGPVESRPEPAVRGADGVTPGVVCYYFRRRDFVELGERLGVRTEIRDIHRSNPYFGYRFNAVYEKPRG
jgi:SAM-dependent methyltransferase